MKGRWMIGVALAMQVALVSVSAPPPAPHADVGGSFRDAAICAGCIAGGIVAVSSGAAEAAAVTVAVGGSAAVGLAGVIGACVYSCYNALT